MNGAQKSPSTIPFHAPIPIAIAATINDRLKEKGILDNADLSFFFKSIVNRCCYCDRYRRMERYRRRTFLCSVHRPSLALHAIAFYGVRTDVSLFHSAGVFFAEDANTVPNWRYGAFIWIAPSALLALTWTLCWGQTRHSVR